MVLFSFGHFFFIVALIYEGFIILQERIENLVDYSLLQLSVGNQTQTAKEWIQNGCEIIQRYQVVHFIHLFQKNVANLKRNTCCSVCRFLGIQKQCFYQLLVPLHQLDVVVALFQELKNLVELESKEHEELVDPEVIHFIPMHVENVQKSLKPLLFVLVIS